MSDSVSRLLDVMDISALEWASRDALCAFVRCHGLELSARGGGSLYASVTFWTGLGTLTGPARVVLEPIEGRGGRVRVDAGDLLPGVGLDMAFDTAQEIYRFDADTRELVIRGRSHRLAGPYTVRLAPLPDVGQPPGP